MCVIIIILKNLITNQWSGYMSGSLEAAKKNGIKSLQNQISYYYYYYVAESGMIKVHEQSANTEECMHTVTNK